jgi:hypothetical protein
VVAAGLVRPQAPARWVGCNYVSAGAPSTGPPCFETCVTVEAQGGGGAAPMTSAILAARAKLLWARELVLSSISVTEAFSCGVQACAGGQ